MFSGRRQSSPPSQPEHLPVSCHHPAPSPHHALDLWKPCLDCGPARAGSSPGILGEPLIATPRALRPLGTGSVPAGWPLPQSLAPSLLRPLRVPSSLAHWGCCPSSLLGPKWVTPGTQSPLPWAFRPPLPSFPGALLAEMPNAACLPHCHPLPRQLSCGLWRGA